MEKKLHLIMPMGGAGSRFSKNGFEVPKPIIEIKNKPFFYWAVQSIKKNTDISGITFVVLEEHIKKFSIDRQILSYFPEARFQIIPMVLNGAVLTCLEGIKGVGEKTPIMFNDCDHMFTSSAFYNFCNSGFTGISGKKEIIDGALLTFKSREPKFSFAQTDKDGNVIKTAEKTVISEEAICGAYYFRDKVVFREAAQEYLDICNYKEYFMSGVYNIMAVEKKRIKTFKTDFHLSFGTPDEYMEALKSDKFEVLE